MTVGFHELQATAASRLETVDPVRFRCPVPRAPANTSTSTSTLASTSASSSSGQGSDYPNPQWCPRCYPLTVSAIRAYFLRHPDFEQQTKGASPVCWDRVYRYYYDSASTDFGGAPRGPRSAYAAAAASTAAAAQSMKPAAPYTTPGPSPPPRVIGADRVGSSRGGNGGGNGGRGLVPPLYSMPGGGDAFYDAYIAVAGARCPHCEAGEEPARVCTSYEGSECECLCSCSCVRGIRCYSNVGGRGAQGRLKDSLSKHRHMKIENNAELMAHRQEQEAIERALRSRSRSRGPSRETLDRLMTNAPCPPVCAAYPQPDRPRTPVKPAPAVAPKPVQVSRHHLKSAAVGEQCHGVSMVRVIPQANSNVVPHHHHHHHHHHLHAHSIPGNAIVGAPIAVNTRARTPSSSLSSSQSSSASTAKPAAGILKVTSASSASLDKTLPSRRVVEV